MIAENAAVTAVAENLQLSIYNFQTIFKYQFSNV